MSKGNNFERDICKSLGLWWTYGERDDIFWRTAGSGARHTTRMKQSKATSNSAGDVKYLDEIGKPFIDRFLIEIKRGYTSTGRIVKQDLIGVLNKPGDQAANVQKYITSKLKKGGDIIDVLDFIDTKKECTLIKWWKKAQAEAITAKRDEILIIFKRDLKSECIMTTYNVIDRYSDIDDFRLIQFEPAGFEEQYVIVALEEFFKKIEPKHILTRR